MLHLAMLEVEIIWRGWELWAISNPKSTMFRLKYIPSILGETWIPICFNKCHVRYRVWQQALKNGHSYFSSLKTIHLGLELYFVAVEFELWTCWPRTSSSWQNSLLEWLLPWHCRTMHNWRAQCQKSILQPKFYICVMVQYPPLRELWSWLYSILSSKRRNNPRLQYWSVSYSILRNCTYYNCSNRPSSTTTACTKTHRRIPWSSNFVCISQYQASLNNSLVEDLLAKPKTHYQYNLFNRYSSPLLH